MLILRSPIDEDQLASDIELADVVQFDEPLSDHEYQKLSQLLERHPQVTLRAYGFDPHLTKLEFLRFFPRLRRFSMAHLDKVADVAPLNVLSDELEVLDVGETSKPLDLTPLKFKALRHLRVAAHNRGLREVLANNPNLSQLTLANIKADKVLADAELPGNLAVLRLVLGSAVDLSWLKHLRSLRHLALRRVRGVADEMLSAALKQLPALEWLWLDALSGVSKMPDISANTSLQRIDLDSMTQIRAQDALAPLSASRNLRELSVTSSKLPASAFEVLAGHPKLVAVTAGLGNLKRNQDAQRAVGLEPAISAQEYASKYEL